MSESFSNSRSFSWRLNLLFDSILKSQGSDSYRTYCVRLKKGSSSHICLKRIYQQTVCISAVDFKVLAEYDFQQ